MDCEKEHLLIYKYKSRYREIKKIGNSINNVKLVHISEIQDRKKNMSQVKEIIKPKNKD